MNRAVLCLALLSATGAAAQTVHPRQYFPMDDGNVWLYRFDRRVIPGGGAPADTLRGFAEMRVDGDTLIEDRVWKRLRLRQFTLAGVETARGASAAEYDIPDKGDWWVSMRYQAATSNPVTGTPAAFYGLRLIGWGSPRDVVIGGIVYRVAGAYRSFDLGWLDGLGRGAECNGTDFAADVGVTGFDCGYGFSAPYISEQSQLVYARVGSREYGINLVSGEDAPAVTVRALRAFPNPARASVTVEAGEASAVTVVDALGRVVAHGEVAPGRPLRLDVAAWPGGLYVARASGASGSQTVRLVVAR